MLILGDNRLEGLSGLPSGFCTGTHVAAITMRLMVQVMEMTRRRITLTKTESG